MRAHPLQQDPDVSSFRRSTGQIPYTGVRSGRQAEPFIPQICNIDHSDFTPPGCGLWQVFQVRQVRSSPG